MGIGHEIHARKAEQDPGDPWVASTDPDAYDAQISERLAPDYPDPVKREKALGAVRKYLPDLAPLNDEDIHSYAQTSKGRPQPRAAVNHTATGNPEVQMGRRLAAAGQALGSINAKVATNEARPEEITPKVADAIQNAKLEAPPLNSLLQKQRTEDGDPAKETTRFPLLQDQRELRQKAKEEGLEQTLPGYGLGTQVTLNKPFNKGGDTKYALDEWSSYAPAATNGASAVGYFTGASDPIQHSISNLVADTTGVDKMSSLGERYYAPGGGLDPRSGYGFPELGGDIGELNEKWQRGKAKAAGQDPNAQIKTVSNLVAGGAKAAESGYGGYATLKEMLSKAAKSVMPPDIDGPVDGADCADGWDEAGVFMVGFVTP